MQLEDSLRICLLAIESRYPDHVVDCTEVVSASRIVDAIGWSALDLLTYLEQTTPDLLEAPALLIVDIQKSEIYLVERSQQRPALVIHCRGRLPLRKTHVPSQQLTQA